MGRLRAAAGVKDWVAVEQVLAALESNRGPGPSNHGGDVAEQVTTLILTLVPTPANDQDDPATIVIAAAPANASGFSARFELPSTVPAGVYTVSISNGAAAGELASFYSQDEPIVTTIEIKPASARLWPEQSFAVNEFGCNASVDLAGRQLNCTAAVTRAMAAARAAGGGWCSLGSGATISPDLCWCRTTSGWLAPGWASLQSTIFSSWPCPSVPNPGDGSLLTAKFQLSLPSWLEIFL